MELLYFDRIYKTGIFLLVQILISLVQSENSTTTQLPPRNGTVHLFLLAVPESYVSKLERLRQDEDDPPMMSFAQTGQYIGNIIQGVLGGDVRPVFTGSLGFVEEPMAQQNLNSFFGTIAPTLNLVLRELYLRAQTAFGFGRPTTSKPVQSASVPQQQLVQQSPLHEVIYGSPQGNKTITSYNGYDTKQQNSNQPQASTTSWQYVLNQIYTETTTPLPLPLIRPRTTERIDVDDGEDEARRRI